MAKIPRIQEGLINSIVPEVFGPQKDPEWMNNMILRLGRENPILSAFIISANKKYGKEAAAVGLLVYKIIESQIHANEVRDLFET